MAKIETRPYDPAEYLDTEDAQVAFLTAALEEYDADFFIDALGIVIRARAASGALPVIGSGNRSPDRAFDVGAKWDFAALLRILQALGIKLTAGPASEKAA